MSKIRMEPAWMEKGHFRADIQGLRAIAVVAVLVSHFFPTWVLPGGFVGVDIFFVISGFVISASIFRDIERKQFSILQFYARRVRRLFPALILVVAATAIAGWRFIFPIQFIDLGREFASAVIFSANIYFYATTGYFQAQRDTLPLLHLWSLGVEEQFYFFFPFLCLIGAGLRKRSAMLFYAAAVVSMAINLAVVQRNPDFAFYMPVTRFWEFFFGIFLAFNQPYFAGHWQNRGYSKKLAELSGVAGLLLILFSVFRIKSSFLFPGYWAIFPCLGAALLIFAGETAVINKFLLSNRVAVFLGTISYPLYLWHWPVFVFVRIATFNDHFSLRVILAMIAASLLLATLTYYVVEKPLAASSLARGNTFALSYIVAFAMLGVFGVAAIPAHGYPWRFTPEMLSLDHDYGDDAGNDFHGGVCFLGTNQPPAQYATLCQNINNVATPKLTVFLWGDSHAADLLGGLAHLWTPRSIRISLYTSSLCAPILDRDAKGRPLCRQTNDFVLEKMRGQKPDIVVLSALWPEDADSYAKLRRTIETIKSSGVKQVVVVGQAPLWNEPVIGVLEGELRRNPDKVLSNYLPAGDLQSSQIDEAGLEAVSEAAGAGYVSLLSRLCNRQGCLVKTGPGWQNIVTFDTAHFTGHGSRYVASLIGDQIVSE